MIIDRVRVARVRNLSAVEIRPHPRFNLIHGENGAGKTALLEAIHLLSDARTFRHAQIRPLIQEGHAEAVVHGELRRAARGGSLVVGVRKQRTGSTEIRMRSGDTLTAVQLAREVPLLTLVEQGEEWTHAGSRGRRAMLDWGMFHVEQAFYPGWQRMRQGLKQRNRLLRRGIMDTAQMEVWNRQICEAGILLDTLRAAYFDALLPRAQAMWNRLLGDGAGLSLDYLRGWDAGRDLAEILAASLQRDGAQGYTGHGPHRADLRITSPMGEPEKILSRGQLKLAYWGLRLAQLELHQDRTGEPALCLVDDLPAELDRSNQARMLAALWDTGAQVFVTALESGLALPAGSRSEGLGMFHVKQGAVEPDGPVSGEN